MRLLSALLVFCSLGYAEVINPGGGTIAHIADGGGIQVEFVLINLDDTANTYTLNLYDDRGNPLSLETSAGTGSEFSGTLAPYGSRSIRSAGTAANVTQGWASVQIQGGGKTGGAVGTLAILRFSTGPWKGSKAVVPLDTWWNSRFSVAFDNTDSTVIGLAIVNPSPTYSTAVTVTFRGEDGGVIVTDKFNMAGFTHRSFVTASSYPAIAGKRGTIEINSPSSISVLALRFSPAAVSTIPPLVSSYVAVPNTAYYWGY